MSQLLPVRRGGNRAATAILLVALGCLGAAGCSDDSEGVEDSINAPATLEPSPDLTEPGLSGAGTETRPASPEPDPGYLESGEQAGDKE